MVQASIKAVFNTKETTSQGVSGFFLTVEVSDPVNFPEYLKNNYPDYPFVYEAYDLVESKDPTFLRVATVGDITKFGTIASGTAVTFRKSTFANFFETMEKVLAAQELLLQNLRSLYSDINTMFTYISTQNQNFTVTLPNYVETKVSDLITQLLQKRRNITELNTKISLIDNVVLPELQNHLASIETQDDLLTDMKAYMQTLVSQAGAVTLMQTQLGQMNQQLEGAAYEVDKNNSGLATINNHSQTVTNMVNQYAVSGDISPTAQAALNAVTTPLTEASNNTMKTSFFNLTPINAMMGTVMKGIHQVVKIDINQLMLMNRIQTIQDNINYNKVLLNKKQDEANKEKAGYIINVETYKGDIQFLEAELKKLVPSIDLTYPESYWFVKVNVTTS